MANPNMAAKNWRKANPRVPSPPQPVGDFMEWVAVQAREGRRFRSSEEAHAAFEAKEAAAGA